MCSPQRGPTNAAALKRTFGQPESSIRIKLYRDHAAWCPYCQKVWLQLEEKRIPYVLEKINMRCYGDKPASFMAKVSGLITHAHDTASHDYMKLHLMRISSICRFSMLSSQDAF